MVELNWTIIVNMKTDSWNIFISDSRTFDIFVFYTGIDIIEQEVVQQRCEDNRGNHFDLFFPILIVNYTMLFQSDIV